MTLCVCQEQGEAKRPYGGWKTIPCKKGEGVVTFYDVLEGLILSVRTVSSRSSCACVSERVCSLCMSVRCLSLSLSLILSCPVSELPAAFGSLRCLFSVYWLYLSWSPSPSLLLSSPASPLLFSEQEEACKRTW